MWTPFTWSAAAHGIPCFVSSRPMPAGCPSPPGRPRRPPSAISWSRPARSGRPPRTWPGCGLWSGALSSPRCFGRPAATGRGRQPPAGWSRRLYGIKLILAVTLAILSIVFRDSITANPVLRIVLPVAATVAGYWIPGFLLERKVSKRQEKLRLSLPDGLDLMVVSVEAGLGLDQAIQNVGRELAVAH